MKDEPFNLEIFRLQPLKGPERLLRIEIKLNITDKFLPVLFNGDDLKLSLNKFGELVNALLFKYHNLDYLVPVEDIFEALHNLYLKNKTVECVAIAFLFMNKKVEAEVRVWDREHQFVRKARNLDEHYKDLLNNDLGFPLFEFRNGQSDLNFNLSLKTTMFKIKKVSKNDA